MALNPSPSLDFLESHESHKEITPKAKLTLLCESIKLKTQRGASEEEIHEDIKDACATPEARLAIFSEIIKLKDERGAPIEEINEDLKKAARFLLSYLPDTPENRFRRDSARGVIEAIDENAFRKSDAGRLLFNAIVDPIAKIKFLTFKLFGRDISNPKADLDVRGYFLVKHKKDVHDLPLTEIARLLESDFQARDGGAQMSGEAQDQSREVVLSDAFVDSLSGRVQRKLLRAINGKGNVPTREVLSAVYANSDAKMTVALLKAKDRLNRILAQKAPTFEICCEGETLVLARV